MEVECIHYTTYAYILGVWVEVRGDDEIKMWKNIPAYVGKINPALTVMVLIVID
jgi:hypothetical protein